MRRQAAVYGAARIHAEHRGRRRRQVRRAPSRNGRPPRLCHLRARLRALRPLPRRDAPPRLCARAAPGARAAGRAARRPPPPARAAHPPPPPSRTRRRAGRRRRRLFRRLHRLCRFHGRFHGSFHGHAHPRQPLAARPPAARPRPRLGTAGEPRRCRRGRRGRRQPRRRPPAPPLLRPRLRMVGAAAPAADDCARERALAVAGAGVPAERVAAAAGAAAAAGVARRRARRHPRASGRADDDDDKRRRCRCALRRCRLRVAAAAVARRPARTPGSARLGRARRAECRRCGGVCRHSHRAHVTPLLRRGRRGVDRAAGRDPDRLRRGASQAGAAVPAGHHALDGAHGAALLTAARAVAVGVPPLGRPVAGLLRTLPRAAHPDRRLRRPPPAAALLTAGRLRRYAALGRVGGRQYLPSPPAPGVGQ